MARQFLTPIQLPGPPTDPLHAVTKAYVDGLVGTGTGGGGLTLRQTATNTTVNVGEEVWFDTSNGARTAAPPSSPATGGRVAIGNAGPNVVAWSGTVNGDSQGLQLTSPGAAATLIYLGASLGWWVESISTAPGTPGGIVVLPYAATLAVDASQARAFRCSLTGNAAISVPSGGFDGQELTFELFASGAARTATFAAGWELGENVTDRSLAIAAGKIATVRTRCRIGWPNAGTAWRLLARDNGGG